MRGRPSMCDGLTRLMSAASPLATKMSCLRAESTVRSYFVAISSNHSPCPRFSGHVCDTSSVDAPSGMSQSPSVIGPLVIGKRLCRREQITVDGTLVLASLHSVAKFKQQH